VEIIRSVKRLAKRCLGLGELDNHHEQDVDRYLGAYSRHGDCNVAKDPQYAVGGFWEEIGTLQFDFLVGRGLRPDHRLLDIGCGTLRGGRHFIRYLDPGNYTGIDISPKAIKYGKRLVVEEGLVDRRPRLLLNKMRHLTFEQFGGETFQFLLAQSVFTHLMPPHIEECFNHVRRIMMPDSAFYFTVWVENDLQRPTEFEFRYPLSLFENLAAKYGFDMKDFGPDYPHPRNQRMLSVTPQRDA
jgi:SAM-dependent methyltransferase